MEGGTAIVYDEGCAEEVSDDLFDPDHWRRSHAVSAPSGGRGAAWIIQRGPDSDVRDWVLRHYRRGGLVARFVEDSYLWLGLTRSRPWREWHITARLYEQGLPVPRPVAARCQRRGLCYRADLITERVPGKPVSEWVGSGHYDAEMARQVGGAIRQLHDAGACHADLNTHNILVAEDEGVHLIDFDQARITAAADGWREANLRRLRRSFLKISGLPADATPPLWQVLTEAYSG